MTTPTILSAEELAECARRLEAAGGTYAEVFEYCALLGARKALTELRGAVESGNMYYGKNLIYRGFADEQEIGVFRDTRYPLPVREVPRTVRMSNDIDWQIRDGKLWYRLCLPESEWRKHLSPTSESIAQLARDGRYADAALLCGLAANPTTLDPNGGA